MGAIMGLSPLLAVYLCYYAFLSRMRGETTPTISEAIIASPMKAGTYFGATYVRSFVKFTSHSSHIHTQLANTAAHLSLVCVLHSSVLVGLVLAYPRPRYNRQVCFRFYSSFSLRFTL